MADLILLDPEGDVILSVGSSDNSTHKKLLVSSAVLSLASRVFAGMFRSGFREAVEVRSGCCPDFSLEEDDPDAMETILSLLHYQNDKVPDAMSLKALAAVAIHCDKYNCGLALKPWISQWCCGSDLDGSSTADDYGHMLLAAHLFQASSFSVILRKATENLAPGFMPTWEEQGITTRLPEWLEGTLTSHIGQLSERLHRELQDVEGRLRAHNSSYAMTGLICVCCGRTHPDTAKQCHPCKNTNLFGKMCTKEYRISEYFSILARCEVWPSVKPFQSYSVSDISRRLSVAKDDHRHHCAVRNDCPLIFELGHLAERTSRVLEKMRTR